MCSDEGKFRVQGMVLQYYQKHNYRFQYLLSF